MVELKTRSFGVVVRGLQGRLARFGVVIEADGQVRYETVVRVMSELQKAGIARVGLSVQVK